MKCDVMVIIDCYVVVSAGSILYDCLPCFCERSGHRLGTVDIFIIIITNGNCQYLYVFDILLNTHTHPHTHPPTHIHTHTQNTKYVTIYSEFACPLATSELSVLITLSTMLIVPSSNLFPACPSCLPFPAGDLFCRLRTSK